jgi:hypothetical protein
MRRCGTASIPENNARFHRPPLKALAVPDQNTRIVIPVVFHVVGNSSVQNLLTDERINQQIKQINQDFSATNSDIDKVPSPFKPWVGSSARISFELRQTVRKTTSATSFQANLNNPCSDSIKFTSLGGSNAIETDKNLNIWAGNIYNSLPDGLLGYAMFPWTRNLGSCYASADGVVVHHEVVGSISLPNPGSLAPFYNLGRTMTHELGHYLGFRHMWNDMWNDCAETTCCRSLPDLPAQKGPNYEKPIFPHRANTCSASSTSPASSNGDMFMNYMDYVDDDTMCMFSESQLSLAMDMCLQYRPNMVRQFRSTSTSSLNLSGLNAFRNNDVYKCVVINENGSVVLESDYVRATTS